MRHKAEAAPWQFVLPYTHISERIRECAWLAATTVQHNLLRKPRRIDVRTNRHGRACPGYQS
jgi:hypothetical protein